VIMKQSDPWNLIASGAHQDVWIEVAESLQHDDRYEVVLGVGSDEIAFICRDLEFLGIWLGMLSLEMGRGIDLAKEVKGIAHDSLRLTRDLTSGGFQVEYQSIAQTRAIALTTPQTESLRQSLADALRELEIV